MNTAALIRDQVKIAHDWFEGTMDGVTNEVAHWQPGGRAHPIGSLYAHVVVFEDSMINNVLQGEEPLHATAFAGKTGMEDPQTAYSMTLEWAQNVRVEMGAMREYAQAVYAKTDAYLESLTEEDLERDIDLGAYGTWKLASLLLAFVFGHTRDIMGEVSALKGVKGLQGYPF